MSPTVAPPSRPIIRRYLTNKKNKTGATHRVILFRFECPDTYLMSSSSDSEISPLCHRSKSILSHESFCCSYKRRGHLEDDIKFSIFYISPSARTLPTSIFLFESNADLSFRRINSALGTVHREEKLDDKMVNSWLVCSLYKKQWRMKNDAII